MNIAEGMVVYPQVINKRVMEELPFMATEDILMAAVKQGGDRQELHERIRVHSMASAKNVKEKGLPNDLLERIANDPLFDMDLDELQKVLNPALFIGRSIQQVEEFLTDYVKPLLRKNPIHEMHIDLNV